MTIESSEIEEEKAEPKHEDEGELLEVNFVNDRRFWMGLGVPMAPPAVVFLLALTGILDGNSSPAIMGIIYFMCSLCLWPIIGFGIAVSRNTFVETFRAGARVSAILSLVIVTLFWMAFSSWTSGGITN